jgi:outer membrane lipoprotein-sorting protein
VHADPLTGPELIKMVNDQLNPKSSRATMTMTITTSSGEKRTFEYESYTREYGEKNLMVYTRPRRVRGQKMLMLNHADDIWMFFVRTRRVRKLATHAKKQKFEGSDFSHEDLGSGDAYVTDFTTQRLDDTTIQEYDCYQLELTPKPDVSTSYAKMIMFVNKDNVLPVRIDYYAEDHPKQVEKVLTLSDFQTIDSVPTATSMEMVNQSDLSRTVVTLEDIEYNIDLDDDLFTERGLRR